jgi:transcriptional regulator with XRE-family HTH domain
MRRKRINNYLRFCRKARGLSQTQVAFILGLGSTSMISRWEAGVSLPDTLNSLRMAVIYNTTVDFLYEDARQAMLDELSTRAGALVNIGTKQRG